MACCTPLGEATATSAEEVENVVEVVPTEGFRAVPAIHLENLMLSEMEGLLTMRTHRRTVSGL
jgi:hypothetical protein